MFPIGIRVFADDTHHVAPLYVTTYGSKYHVYKASQFAQGFIRAKGHYMSFPEHTGGHGQVCSGFCLHVGGFSTASVRIHIRKKAAVVETFCAANVHILARKERPTF